MPFDGSREHQINLAWEQHRRRRPSYAWRTSTRDRLAEAQNHRCCYCLCRMDGSGHDPDAPTLEHIIPKARGGDEWAIENLAVACYDCNCLRNDAIWPVHMEVITSGAVPVEPAHVHLITAGVASSLRAEYLQ